MVYRDLSFSLAAHVALIVGLLAFSAARPPLRLPEAVRPVRLVTSLEPAAAAPMRATRAALPPPPPVAAARKAEPLARTRAIAPPPVRAASAPAKTVAPIAIPKIVIPSGARAPEAPSPAAPGRPGQRPAATDTALRDRLARRLATPPGETRPALETVAPKIARLPPPEAPTVPPQPLPVRETGVASAVSTAAVPPGSVQSIGFFPHAWYLAVLKERIFSRWAPPSEFFGARSVTALVSFRIDRAGRIDRVAVKEGSGHARFDRSVVSAIRGLTQLPGLPEQYQEETLDVVIRFQNE